MINVDRSRIYHRWPQRSLISLSFLISFNLAVSVHTYGDANLHKLDEATTAGLIWSLSCCLLRPLAVINGSDFTTYKESPLNFQNWGNYRTRV